MANFRFIVLAATTALILWPGQPVGAQRPYDLPSAIRAEDLTYSTGRQPTPTPKPAIGVSSSEAWRTVDRVWPRGRSSITLGHLGNIGEDLSDGTANLSPQERAMLDRVESAAALDRQGERDRARAELLAVLEANPASRAATRAVYELALLEDDVSQAIAMLDRLATHRPNSRWATEAALKTGDYAMLVNQFETAVVGYGVFLRRRADSELATEARMQKANALRKLGRHNEAMAEYETMLRQGASEEVAAEVIENVADSLMAQGRFVEAAQRIDKIVQSGSEHPHLPILLLNQGLCLEELGRYAEARGRYDYLKRRFPSNIASKLAQERLNDLSRPLLPPTPGTSVYMPMQQAPPTTPTQQPIPDRTAPPAMPREPARINPTQPTWPIEPPPRATPKPAMRNMFDIDGAAVFPNGNPAATGNDTGNKGAWAFPESQ